MGLSQALNTAMSGLRATQASLALVSSNVANAETPGYVKKTVNQVTGLTGDYGSSVLVNGVNRQLDAYLQSQVRTETSGASYAAVRANYLSNLQTVYGNPDESGTIENAFNNLLTALQGLSTSPDSQSARIGVVNAAQSMAQQLNATTAGIQSLRANAETVEVVGLDEAYLDLTGLFAPKATMRRIATEIREDLGLSCSVGISENRLLAKITSELGKPAGLVVLSRAEALERFGGQPPGLVPGIGPKTVLRLEKMGIRTLAELRAHDPAVLERAFGPRMGRWLPARARFEDETPIAVARETKSQSAETTFDVDVADQAEMAAHVTSLAEELCRRLRSRDLEGRTIGIKVRLDDWTTVTRVRTLPVAVNDTETITRVAIELLRAYAPPRPVRLLGVRTAAFSDEEGEAARAPAAVGQLALEL